MSVQMNGVSNTGAVSRSPLSAAQFTQGGGGYGLSAERVAEVFAKILERTNREFEGALNRAQNSAGSNQSNTDMIRVQQKMGQVNVVQSTATAAIQGMTDASKQTAAATK